MFLEEWTSSVRVEYDRDGREEGEVSDGGGGGTGADASTAAAAAADSRVDGGRSWYLIIDAGGLLCRMKILNWQAAIIFSVSAKS